MCVTFYYDDRPEGGNRLLRLYGPKLLPGYVTYLRATYSDERLRHIRVQSDNGDMRLEDYEHELE